MVYRPPNDCATPCTVYLLHFTRPVAHARHYLGIVTNGRSVEDRLKEHRAGRGARLTRAAVRAGAELVLVRTWPNVPRSEERRLKNRGGAARLCPTCRTELREGEHR